MKISRATSNRLSVLLKDLRTDCVTTRAGITIATPKAPSTLVHERHRAADEIDLLLNNGGSN